VTTDTPLTLGLRIPNWCAVDDVRLDGSPVVPADGYLQLRRDWQSGVTLTLELPMPVRVVRPHSRIDAVRGCVALARGPLVYCVEQADLPDGVTLEDVQIDPSAPVVVNHAPAVTLTMRGSVRRADTDLYPAAIDDAADPITITALPYFLWGNRKPGPMRVWLPVT